MENKITKVLWEGNDYLRIKEIEKKFDRIKFFDITVKKELNDALDGEIFLVTPTSDGKSLKSFLDQGLKWVHCMGHGVDHLPLKKLNGCVITCSRGTSSGPIAEWIMAMILTSSKDLPNSWVSKKPKHWFLTPLKPLSGATIALLGFGSINQEVARRLEPFGSRILALSRTQEKSSLPFVETVSTVEEAVSEADHIVVAMPLTDSTYHFLNADSMKLFKPGAHLINVARGDIVDQKALFNCLESGQLKRASLDVVSPEPLPQNHWLYTHPQVMLSPHISWSDPNYIEYLHKFFLTNLEKWLLKEPLEGLVSRKVGY